MALTDVEAEALLATLDIWEQRHRKMAPSQRCSPDPFDATPCVDDLYTLAQARPWWMQ